MDLLKVLVARRHRETDDIALLELRAEDGGQLPAFSAGSHVDVHLGEGLVRQYSLCNSPSERDRYLLGILRAPDSRGGSVAAHERLVEGCRLAISAPRNLFALVPGQRAILFAGGIGITPLLSMAEALADAGTPFAFHYNARSRAQAAFLDRLQGPRLRGAVQLHLDDGAPSQKLQLAQVLGEADPKAHLYVCGPAGYIEWVTSFAAKTGWPEENVHVEHFTAMPVAGAADAAFAVQLASSGDTIPVGAGQSILDALRECGVDAPSSCEQGICGTCLTRVVEGEPDHRDMYLTEAERSRGDQILICCSRARGRLLVLDL